MKQKTRHHVQRVAAGILASILTLSGIGVAHAGEKGKLLTECKPYTIYTFGYGDGNNVDGGTWNITGENLNGNKDDSFEIPVNRPDIPHLSDEEFSTDSADYHLEWVQELYYQSEYVATTDNCTFIHGYQFQPLLTINAHQGVTLTEETVRADLRKQYPNVLGHSLDYYFPQFVAQSPTRWVNPENNYYHVDERIQLDGSVHVFNLHRIGQPAVYGRTPAAFGFEDSFFRFPHNSNRVEKLEGDTWVTVARTPFVFETVTNLANRGVVMVEPDRRTSHFVRFEDLTRGDLSHAVTSTATVDYAGEQVSPFSDNGFNNQGLYTVDASQILHPDSELTGVWSRNLSGVVDDISRQLGEPLPQLLPTSLEYTWAIPANATPAHKTKRTVTFTSDEPCPASKSVTAVDGDQLTTPVFTCDGYQLAGWDVHSNQGVARVEQTPFTFTVKGDMTVVAQWRKSIPMTDLQPAHKTERSVRFHSNDKRDIVVTVHAVDGDTVSLKTGLTRTGYLLAGWATSPESSTLAYPVAGRLTVDGDMDLYAVWKPVSEPVKPSNTSQKPSHTPAQKTVQPAGEQRVLASTGAGVGLLGLLAVVAVALGGVLLLMVRQRR